MRVVTCFTLTQPLPVLTTNAAANRVYVVDIITLYFNSFLTVFFIEALFMSLP